MTHRTPRLLFTALLLSALAPPIQAEPVAGSVVLMTGQASALGSDGTVRKLAKNDPVFAGDLINSGVGSYVNLKFADGAFFLLRPETRFQIEAFSYPVPAAGTATPGAAAPGSAASGSAASGRTAPGTPSAPPPPVEAVKPVASPPIVVATAAPPGSRAFFRLVKGGFRAVSGLIGKLDREDYRVSTPVATIGIRGTAYSARLCEGDCEDRSEIETELKSAGQPVQPDDLLLVTTVDEGSIELQSDQGVTVQNACTAGTTCGAVITSPGGSSFTTPSRPPTEQQERSLDPATCS